MGFFVTVLISHVVAVVALGVGLVLAGLFTDPVYCVIKYFNDCPRDMEFHFNLHLAMVVLAAVTFVLCINIQPISLQFASSSSSSSFKLRLCRVVR